MISVRFRNSIIIGSIRNVSDYGYYSYYIESFLWKVLKMQFSGKIFVYYLKVIFSSFKDKK